MWPGVELPQ